MRKLIALVLPIALLSTPAWAGPRTVKLTVPGMTCATCPITVKKALQKVDGVIDAKVTWEPREATVTFDDAKTNLRAMTEATRNAGYPSTAITP